MMPRLLVLRLSRRHHRGRSQLESPQERSRSRSKRKRPSQTPFRKGHPRLSHTVGLMTISGIEMTMCGGTDTRALRVRARETIGRRRTLKVGDRHLVHRGTLPGSTTTGHTGRAATRTTGTRGNILHKGLSRLGLAVGLAHRHHLVHVVRYPRRVLGRRNTAYHGLL